MPTIAVGPALPGIGSWEWLGTALAAALQQRHAVKVFRDRVPDCDVVLLIKSFPECEDVVSLAERSPVVYCPIDRYGSAADIDRHASFLSRCAQIVIHSATLRKYFQSYAPVEYVDHPLKYAAEPRKEIVTDGPILWVGVKNNLPPLVEWANSSKLAAELWVLTDLPDGRDEMPATDLGFATNNSVRVSRWNAARHLQWASQARAAVDVKGDDFRSRHKPSAKAIDYLVSGLALAVNTGHAAQRHLSQMGFALCDVRDTARWFSGEYRQDCLRFGATLRKQLSAERVGKRMEEILEQALQKWIAA